MLSLLDDKWEGPLTLQNFLCLRPFGCTPGCANCNDQPPAETLPPESSKMVELLPVSLNLL